jgi:hypothetical protein
LTYLRRYSLAALLGIVADDDDDASAAQPPRGASHHPQQRRPEPTPPPRQAADDPERAALVAQLAERKGAKPEAFEKVPTPRLAEMLKEAA